MRHVGHFSPGGDCGEVVMRLKSYCSIILEVCITIMYLRERKNNYK